MCNINKVNLKLELERSYYPYKKDLDTNKSAGPDKLDLITMPLTTILNPCLNANVIPLICDCDPTILNNYRPISADQF